MTFENLESWLSSFSNASPFFAKCKPGHWSGPIRTAGDEETHEQMSRKGCREKSPGIMRRVEQRLGRNVCWHHAHRWTQGGRHGYAEWAEAAADETALTASLSSSPVSLLEIKSPVTRVQGCLSRLALLQNNFWGNTHLLVFSHSGHMKYSPAMDVTYVINVLVVTKYKPWTRHDSFHDSQIMEIQLYSTFISTSS